MKKPVIIHPILFAVYPILFLYSQNSAAIPVQGVIYPVGLSLFLSSLLWILLTGIIKNRLKAGLILSLFLFFFFSFGYFVQITTMPFYRLFRTVIGPKTVLFLIWGLLLLMAVFLILRTTRSLSLLNTFFNITPAILIIFILCDLGLQKIKRGFYPQNTERISPSYQPERNWKDKKRFPDIYYIILDGYARSDVLREIYQVDNKVFMDYLKQKGFFVAEKSCSNYGQTLLSLASTMNYKYLDEQDGINSRTNDSYPLVKMIEQSRLIRVIKRFGYRSVGLVPGVNELELIHFDITILNRFELGEFNNALLETTPISMVLNKYTKLYNPFQNHRKRVLYSFDHMDKISETIDGPVFIYAHILIPHPPFVFGPNGEEVPNSRTFSQSLWDGNYFIEAGGSREEYVKKYRDQILYTTKKIQETLDRIIRKAAKPTVIILQADHGPGSMLDLKNPEKTNFKERFAILNAYYFSDRPAGRFLYDSISPVNSFRVLLNVYFKAGFKLLNDKSFFSTWKEPYRFIPVRIP